MQGRGSNNRKLTLEEKAFAQESFYKALQENQGSMLKTRSPMKWLKSFSEVKPPPVPSLKELKSHLGKDDDLQWMEETEYVQELEEYLIEELDYTEALLAKNFYLTSDLLREYSARKPEPVPQTIEKGGVLYNQVYLHHYRRSFAQERDHTRGL